MQDFKPYSNESEVIRIGGLEIENRLDRITLTGDLVLTKDQQGLALANELRIVATRIVKTLEREKKLPESVEIKPAQTVPNPFL
ncbi:MAG: hypothetical protein PHX60_02340 [Giesbergeria sp.]|uniref:hypothetical protein n=1 Tax=Giesbergeria sp. TaxID=2818473 RepID=UPI0026315615|nr:hypothetical protein [Giesbergeria sp.]MDD2608518.1 hypothetical protein [Giesbergeria sp.]